MDRAEICRLNGLNPEEDMHILQSMRFPDEEFSGDFTIVLYSQNGISDIKIDGRDFVLRRKCVSVMHPGQKILFHPDGSLVYQVLLISGTLAHYLNAGNAFLTLFVTDEYPVIRVTTAYNDVLRRFFESITIVNGLPANPYKKACQLSLLQALFYSTGYYVSKSLHVSEDGLANFVRAYPSVENSTVTRFISLIEQHSATQRRMSFYAALMDYNPKYLSALVKRETGHSGQDLIDQYSLLAAMARLSYGHLSIKEISNELGFQSQSDFGKFFKRLTGLSPSSYRKRRFRRII